MKIWGLWALLVGLAGGPPQDQPFASAEGCAGCHAAAVAEWTGSRHRESWTNLIFQAEYQRGAPDPFCVGCHAPLPEQRAEALNGAPGQRAHEGITCVACHPTGSTSHPEPGAAAAGGDDLCLGCHDFDFPGSTEPMQATGREAVAVGVAGCASCHMPQGSHRFPGSHDLELLRSALSVSVARQGKALSFQVQARDAGHAVPTGDLYRHLTLELQTREGWTVLAWLGRRLAPDEVDPRIRRTTLDTRLWPGRPMVVTTGARGSAWRLRYHYAPDSSPLPESQRVVEVLSGRL